ncbi:hypothetical protein VNO77_08218 [Canavalia gladiata]|uniref:Uncharacterized protein n=1 Tax=Canavalia gladiata TaxID=3824 RepID=A0AAN9R0Y9_CANGL
MPSSGESSLYYHLRLKPVLDAIDPWILRSVAMRETSVRTLLNYGWSSLKIRDEIFNLDDWKASNLKEKELEEIKVNIEKAIVVVNKLKEASIALKSKLEEEKLFNSPPFSTMKKRIWLQF